MSLKRRDLLTLGGVAALGSAAALAVPARSVSAKSASSLSSANFPRRYAAPLPATTAAAATVPRLPGASRCGRAPEADC